MTDILNVSFTNKNMKEVIDVLQEHLINGNGVFHVVTANPEIVMRATQDDSFNQLLKEVQLITPDGIGVILASKLIHQPLPERVAGYDMIHELLKFRESRQMITKVFCLGAKEEVIESATKKLAEMYTCVEIVGFHHGYFQPNSEKEKEVVSAIQNAKPDLLLVGLGCPRQEKFIYTYRDSLNVKVAVGCGGTFDVLSGTVKRAPVLFQKAGLEWFYRLLQNPTRLKRQLELPKFVLKVLKEHKRNS